MFESRITQQLGSGQMPNIADARSKIAKIKKMVMELYERPIIAEPVVETIISTVEVPKIWEEQVRV